MLSIRLPEEIESRLEKLAKKTGRSKTFYVREAILAYLEDLEDFYLAEKRVQRYDDSRAVSLEDVLERNGLGVELLPVAEKELRKSARVVADCDLLPLAPLR